MIPGFAAGQGIISGRALPLPVRVDMHRELLTSEIEDQDFFEQAEASKRHPPATLRDKIDDSVNGFR
jgi:hypothetical protein